VWDTTVIESRTVNFPTICNVIVSCEIQMVAVQKFEVVSCCKFIFYHQ